MKTSGLKSKFCKKMKVVVFFFNLHFGVFLLEKKIKEVLSLVFGDRTVNVDGRKRAYIHINVRYLVF